MWPPLNPCFKWFINLFHTKKVLEIFELRAIKSLFFRYFMLYSLLSLIYSYWTIYIKTNIIFFLLTGKYVFRVMIKMRKGYIIWSGKISNLLNYHFAKIEQFSNPICLVLPVFHFYVVFSYQLYYPLLIRKVCEISV